MDSSSYDTRREESDGIQGQATSLIDIVTPIWDLEMTYREILEIKQHCAENVRRCDIQIGQGGVGGI